MSDYKKELHTYNNKNYNRIEIPNYLADGKDENGFRLFSSKELLREGYLGDEDTFFIFPPYSKLFGYIPDNTNISVLSTNQLEGSDKSHNIIIGLEHAESNIGKNCIFDCSGIKLVNCKGGDKLKLDSVLLPINIINCNLTNSEIINYYDEININKSLINNCKIEAVNKNIKIDRCVLENSIFHSTHGDIITKNALAIIKTNFKSTFGKVEKIGTEPESLKAFISKGLSLKYDPSTFSLN